MLCAELSAELRFSCNKSRRRSKGAPFFCSRISSEAWFGVYGFGLEFRVYFRFKVEGPSWWRQRSKVMALESETLV